MGVYQAKKIAALSNSTSGDDLAIMSMNRGVYPISYIYITTVSYYCIGDWDGL
jgi:hypothetical protein